MAGIDSIRTPADIARMPLITDTARQGWHDWFRAAKVRGATLDEHYAFSDSNAALNAAALGLGVALARDKIVAPFLDGGLLVRLPGPALRARWRYYLIHPSHRRLRSAAQVFVDWLLQEVATAPP